MYVLDTIVREQIECFVGDINGESENFTLRGSAHCAAPM